MKYLLSIMLTFVTFISLFGQSEASYANQINDLYFKGKREVTCQNGRADIVTNTYAIEVEMAQNWKHSIGQALWYGLQLNRQPGIVLVMKDISERKYGIMLNSALQYAGIEGKIKVWFYPEDFGIKFSDVISEPPPRTNQIKSSDTRYTLNKTSKIRHNQTCVYFTCGNCITTDSGQGRACTKCGG